MGPIAFVKEYWRILLLVVFLTAALVALFIPGGIMADDDAIEANQTSATNIEYGIGLDGGTRLSAPVVGLTAENLDAGAVSDDGQVDQDRLTELETAIREDLGVDRQNMSISVNDDGTVSAEVFTRDVTKAEFAGVLQDQGIDVTEDDIRNGVTEQTRNQLVQTIQDKINAAGLSGGNVYVEDRVGEGNYIVTEVPNMAPSELRELLSERGTVELWAYYPAENGTHTNETILLGENIVNVDPPTQRERGSGYQVPVQVSEEAAPGFQSRLNELGFTGVGQGQCNIRGDGQGVNFNHEGSQYCLITVVDGEPVDAHSMGPRLADNMQSGTWQDDPSFFMGTPTYEEAQSLSINLRAGALPAPLDFNNEQVYSLQPSLADQFKLYSLFIGLLSVVAVSGVVFLRYRDPKVAAPMILTATAEVAILLGFVAAIRMPIDLSHVAGFIAVIGTGVDDLVIIADEVMDEGDVSSQRVFESRFRKAFWVIGAAAATTIIALSPLAVLSLGDLRGFAIITILGVLIGVLITRPAYGDILQRLLTDK
ncbi:preprotein translocase subunit SecD [Halopiger aswanensis]|uniref:Protein-export membrane protein SecD n=1 Tax=Halopiger aswanensis TaxID=148449 RepID=A0A419WJV7_9EURY|nr:preprotein translocase subunit SecD [Halopiger aswanensis]RKD95749.1 preprotein translocase subunit SecD [Halopiger aswanensis]